MLTKSEVNKLRQARAAAPTNVALLLDGGDVYPTLDDITKAERLLVAADTVEKFIECHAGA